MFYLNQNTQIEITHRTKPIENAIQIFLRDRNSLCEPSNQMYGNIRLNNEENCEKEAYRIEITSEQIKITANSDLGFIYALLYISEHGFGVKPFWFWLEQPRIAQEAYPMKEGIYESKEYLIRYRGWFFNDEVLMMKCKLNEYNTEGWKLAFETLLRCGGNLVIPGTDKIAV